MSTYLIQTASWNDMDDLQSLAANALRNSPIASALLTDRAGTRSNTVHTRHTLAHFIYLQALHAQDAITPTSKVLKAINSAKPTPEVQACAWLQWFSAEPRAVECYDDDDGEAGGGVYIDDMPREVNENAWRMVEEVKHTYRKALMKGDGHYLIRTLDFDPVGIQGHHAAREILSRIHRMDPPHPVIVIIKPEYSGLYQESG